MVIVGSNPQGLIWDIDVSQCYNALDFPSTLLGFLGHFFHWTLSGESFEQFLNDVM